MSRYQDTCLWLKQQTKYHFRCLDIYSRKTKNTCTSETERFFFFLFRVASDKFQQNEACKKRWEVVKNDIGIWHLPSN